MKKLKGLGVSPGIAFGKAWIWKTSFLTIPGYMIDKSKVEEEIYRLNEAIIEAEKEIAELQENLRDTAGEEYAEIFSFHRFLLRDKFLREETEKIIRNENVSCENALRKVIQKIGKEFGKKGTDFLKDRRRDLLDVVEKIISNLRGTPSGKIKKFKNEIVVAEDLSPTQTLSLDKRYVRGFVTDIGSKTSHTAIIARALEIPAVVGVRIATKEIENGNDLIVDGTEGIIIINPTPSLIEKYKKKKEEEIKLKRKFNLLKKLPSITKDKERIILHANIEFPEEVTTVKKYGADGIGLFRTEYLYLNRKDLPSEEEQFLAYKSVLEKMEGKTVIIRTIDIGGDKFISHFPAPRELNPFLGWRGIRFCLERKDIFETQIKAILRAAYHGDLKVMFPMVSTVSEVIEAKKFIDEVKEILKKEGKEFNPDIEIGIMIEIPSAALLSEELSKHVDFFSIGSNDLIQYTLAVDRINEKIAHLYQPCHPSVLKLIKITIENAKKNGIWVGICGEMASIPEIACLLIGMGVDELSMAPIAIPAVKEKIRKVEKKKLTEIADKVFEFKSHNEVFNYLKRKLKQEGI